RLLDRQRRIAVVIDDARGDERRSGLEPIRLEKLSVFGELQRADLANADLLAVHVDPGIPELGEAQQLSFIHSRLLVEAKTIGRTRSGNLRRPNPDDLAADLQSVGQHRAFADRTRNVPGSNGRAELEIFRRGRVLPRDADRDELVALVRLVELHKE